MRQSEFKRRFDPEIGRYVRKNICDESIIGGNILQSITSKLFGKTTKELAKKGVKTAATKAATKTGEHIGNKAADALIKKLTPNRRSGEKKVQLLSEKQPEIISPTNMSKNSAKQLSDIEIADRVNRIISGGKKN